ncbi:potassium-transporting ATPase subunit C [Nocardioides jiangsuensis]|uniref:potassium-transporting ATPase subunit C n=1 Tax=Nocardioides jiangsuensis TaxID=2866161 RepID=UPI0027E359FA|nr:potassium-transporting ATPase subunit C [Nocardioides jiangsuensis]
MRTSTPAALRQLGAGLRALLVLTLVVGVAYPLLLTAVAQVVLPDHADGSLVASRDGLVGSELLGQSFTRPVTEDGEPVTDAVGVPVTEPDPAYFQNRPSAAGGGYDPLSSSASNYGPENPDLVALVEERRALVAALDGVDPEQVPPDALLASGSGLDPHISPAYAHLQAARVARERGLAPEQVRRLVDDLTQGRSLGFLGEPRVNVLLLNLALDEQAGTPDEADSE